MISTLRETIGALDGTVSAMHRVAATGNEMELNNEWQNAKGDIDKANQSLDEFDKNLREIDNVQNEVHNGFGGWKGTFAGIAGAIYAVKSAFDALSGAMGVVDDYVLTLSRLNIINDGLQTTAELQESIFQAAQASRGSYSDMAAAVSKLGILAGDAFGDNAEITDFAELMQKTFVVGGASTQEQQSGMYQLTQAMAAGKLQGDEFRSITENASLLAQAIADYTGKSMGDLKEMSSEGLITSDIIKGALFSAADDINSKFETMPKTFGNIMQSIKNYALMSFSPVFERISDFLNSEEFENFTIVIMRGIDVMAAGAMWLMDVFDALGGNIDYVLMFAIPAGAAVALPFLAALVTKAVAFAVAWWAAHWQLALVVIAIGAIGIAAKESGADMQDLTDFLGGFAGALLVTVAIVNNSVAMMWNTMATFAEFLYNVFIAPIYAIKKLFYDLASDVLNYFDSMLSGILSAVNAVMGTDYSVDISAKTLLGEAPTTDKDVWNATRMDYMDLADTWQKGFDAIGNIKDSIAGAVSGVYDSGSSDLTSTDIDNVDTVDTINKINSDVNISDESLKYLIDGITRQYVNKINLQTVQPNISVTFSGDIRETADMNGVAERLIADMEEKMYSSADLAY